MATITEDYVSFETAKLLKEKWFKFIENKDELSTAYIHAYTKEGKEVWGCYSPDYYPCITMSMAMKWLREMHNISIEPLVDFGSGEEYWWTADVGYIKKDGLVTELCGYDSYEEAAEAAIKYCLENLI